MTRNLNWRSLTCFQSGRYYDVNARFLDLRKSLTVKKWNLLALHTIRSRVFTHRQGSVRCCMFPTLIILWYLGKYSDDSFWHTRNGTENLFERTHWNEAQSQEELFGHMWFQHLQIHINVALVVKRLLNMWNIGLEREQREVCYL
jgi:hypothetical protein